MRYLVLAILAATGMTLGAVPALQTAAALDKPAASSVWADKVSVVASHLQVTAGQTFYVALQVELADGWTYYSADPGPYAQEASVAVQPGPLVAGDIRWPADRPHVDPLGTNHVYEGSFVAYVPLRVPADALAGKVSITLWPLGQACGKQNGSDQCVAADIPQPLRQTVEVVVGPEAVANPQWQADLPLVRGLETSMPAWQLAALHNMPSGVASPAQSPPSVNLSIVSGLALALLAGLILNIMPCVLPVLPLKVLSIVEMARQSRRNFVAMGLAFAGGIVAFFLGLAVVNAALRLLTAHALSWGEHFQSSAARIAMTIIVAAVAANLLGLFNVRIPIRLSFGPRRPGRQRAAGPLLRSAGSGVLAAVLSTPCSFAILTLALAWAQAQPVWLGSAVIVLIGVGMALPYAVLAAFPSLVDRLPRPGRWMVLFKQSMGFVMMLVAVWLISPLSPRAGPMWVIAWVVVLAFCAWMWRVWAPAGGPRRRAVLARAVAVALAISSGAWMLRPADPPVLTFVPYDAARLDAARRSGQVVLVDFTADWCLTCKLLERQVYSNPAIAQALKDRNVLVMRGDVTTRDLAANKLLVDGLNEPGVPVTVIFPPDCSGGAAQPIRLRGLFSGSALLDAINTTPTCRRVA